MRSEKSVILQLSQIESSMTSYSLIVNDLPRQIEADETTPLLYVLRNKLGIFSPRYGCGSEQCGACVVLKNGKAIYSCTTQIKDCVDSHITSVEGLHAVHPVQKALLQANAAQCGYCLSGILMRAVQLLDDNPSPTRKEIQSVLATHLCRCGAHNRIIGAIEKAAAHD
jgi:nicotinate dehydrogenase subunit A